MSGIDWKNLIALKAGDQKALFEALTNAGGRVIKPNSIVCCFHDDTNPSGWVYEKDGHWRFKCGACGWCGDWFDVVAESRGLHRSEVIKQFVNDVKPAEPGKIKQRQSMPKEEKQVKTYPHPKAIYEWLKTRCDRVKPYRYIDPETKQDDLVVFRCEPSLDGQKRKGFIQCTPYKGEWALRGVEGKLPLYNRTGIATTDQVVVCEGEKAATALIGIGICATTAPGGAGKDAADVDWSPLEGKEVYLWPDNDEPGITYMQRVAEELERVAGSTTTMKKGVFDLPEKGDAFDAVEYLRGQGASDRTICEAILCEMADAQPMNPSEEVAKHIEDQIAGRFRSVPFEWPIVSSSTKAMTPGTVTVICGDPGDGKSFLLLQAANYWLETEKEKVAIYELEDDRRFHLSRVLAQRSGNNEMLDDEWVVENPDEARENYAMHADGLDRLGRCIWDSPDSVVELSALSEWVRERCEDGCRIIAIDPITMTTTSERRFEDDLEFVVKVKILARQHQVSIILITHPKKGHGKAVGLDELAGGAAYSRFVHTVLWIKRHDQPEEEEVWEVDMLGFRRRMTVTKNRTIHLSKVRNGPGAGTSLAYYFDHKTLRFNELGSIVPDKDRAA